MKIISKKIVIVVVVVVVIMMISLFAVLFSQTKYIDFFTQDIDAVFTWAGPNDSMSERLSYNDELEYSTYLVSKNMPFIKNIHVLMNPPLYIPEWSKKIKNIHFYDHYTTFNDLKNNVTNSNSIEMTLDMIPNLSERFIYFNDDLFVIKETKSTDFFDILGRPIIAKAHANIQEPLTLPFKIPPMYGGYYPHVPFPILKSQMKKFKEEYKDYVAWVQQFNQRSSHICAEHNLTNPCHQLQITLGPYMISNNAAVYKDINLHSDCSNPNYVNFYCLEKLKNPQANIMAVQDTVSNEHDKIIFRNALTDFYQNFCQ